MNLRENFAVNMKTIFERSNHSLTEFADELSISRSSLQDILKGKSNPTLATVELIAEKLDVNPLSLLSFSEEEIQAAFSLTQLLDWLFELSEENRALAAKSVKTFLFACLDKADPEKNSDKDGTSRK